MRVRSDVRKKLFDKLMELRKTNPQQGGWHYNTSKATHYIRIYEGVIYYVSIYYDGTRCWSEEVIHHEAII